MIVTSVQIKTAKTQKHLYCLVFTRQRKPLYEVFFDIEKNFGAVKKVCRRSNSSSGNSAFVVQAKITLKRLFGAKNIVEFYF